MGWTWRLVCVFVIACGTSSEPPAEGKADRWTTKVPVVDRAAPAPAPSSAGDPAEQQLGWLGRIKVQMCQCDGPICTNRIMVDLADWRSMWKNWQPTAAQIQRARALDEKLNACRVAIEEGLRLPASTGRRIDPWKDPTVVMEEFKARMCTCADWACAGPAQADLEAWYKTIRDDDVRLRAIKRELDACRRKAEDATIRAMRLDRI